MAAVERPASTSPPATPSRSCRHSALRRETAASPFAIYRALRGVNPSPYMFLLDIGEFQLVGSSPETHVRLDMDGSCELRPIAGTRRRGAGRERGRRAGGRAAGDPRRSGPST